MFGISARIRTPNKRREPNQTPKTRELYPFKRNMISSGAITSTHPANIPGGSPSQPGHTRKTAPAASVAIRRQIPPALAVGVRQGSSLRTQILLNRLSEDAAAISTHPFHFSQDTCRPNQHNLMNVSRILIPQTFPPRTKPSQTPQHRTC
jgi:hypothetical protein